MSKRRDLRDRGGSPERGELVTRFPLTTTPVYEFGAAKIRNYECAVCHRVDQWGPGWMAYGSLNDYDGGVNSARTRPLEIVCSMPCANVLHPDAELLPGGEANG